MGDQGHVLCNKKKNLISRLQGWILHQAREARGGCVGCSWPPPRSALSSAAQQKLPQREGLRGPSLQEVQVQSGEGWDAGMSCSGPEAGPQSFALLSPPPTHTYIPLPVASVSPEQPRLPPGEEMSTRRLDSH